MNAVAVAASAVCLWAAGLLGVESVYVRNCSFEWPQNTPDFTYIAIPGWNSNRPTVGVAHAGFADNGQRPDKRQVAFLRTPGLIVNLRQELSGLDTNKVYCLQFWHNSYGGTNAGLTNACVFDVALVYGAIQQFIGKGMNGYTNGPVGGTNPYHFEHIIFTPGAETAELRFRNLYWGAGAGDSVLLLDAICLYELAEPPGLQLIVKNPSFEASGEQGPGGSGFGVVNRDFSWGYLADVIAGWEYPEFGYGVGGPAFGVCTNGNPYVAPSSVPEGHNAFFDNKSELWYTASDKQTFLKQTVHGFQTGQYYYVRFAYNARPETANGYSPSNFTLKIGGVEIMRRDFIPWNMQFYMTTLTFNASAASLELVFSTSNSVSGCTMLIDDVNIWLVPEPAWLALAGLGLLALRRRRG